MPDTPRVDAGRLRAFASATCESVGVAHDDAHLVADTLVRAALKGISPDAGVPHP